MNLQEVISGEFRNEIIQIITKSGSRMNWRRDSLKHFFEDNNIDCIFKMSEMKEEINKLENPCATIAIKENQFDNQKGNTRELYKKKNIDNT